MSSWRQTFKRMNHEERVGVCVCACVCGCVGLPLPATLPRHCLHYCWSSQVPMLLQCECVTTLLWFQWLQYVFSKRCTSMMRFNCGNRKSKPPRAPRLQGTIYLSILYPPWLPGQKGQCHKPLWQYAVVLWTDLDRGCWDGHKMPTGWTFALQPCKMILNVCQDQAELRGNYDRLCILCNYILIIAFVTAIVVNVVVVAVVVDVLVFVTILWLLWLYCY